MLVIPIEQSLLYVQPIYISANDEASSTGIPEFKRVVVSYNGKIEMRSTLDEALAAVFGVASDSGEDGSAETPTGTVEEQVVELLARADAAFTAADEAMRNGDLVTWARKIEEAQTAIQQASAALNGGVDTDADGTATTTTTTTPGSDA